MLKSITFGIFILSIALIQVQGKTVQQVLNEAGCNTGVTGPLASQLITKTNQIKPGYMTSIKGVTNLVLSGAAADVPYLQSSALTKIKSAIAARPGNSLSVNSALRSLPQQVLLYKWYQLGKCGITLAATPGTSPHESGLAIDTSDYTAWRTALENAGCAWQGSSDVVHFTCTGTSLGSTSVLAFQKLWNCNNPTDTIAEDGLYGPNTEARVLKSPIEGFTKTC